MHPYLPIHWGLSINTKNIMVVGGGDNDLGDFNLTNKTAKLPSLINRLVWHVLRFKISNMFMKSWEPFFYFHISSVVTLALGS
jgi:hypothetical protein